MLRRLALTAALVGALAAPLEGQVTVGLSASAGAFLPLGNQFDELRLAGQLVAGVGQKPGLSLEGHVTVWMSRLAIEAQVGYAFSDVDIPRAIIDVGLDNGASVTLAALNVIYVLHEEPFSPLRLTVSGGAGVISRHGEFYDIFEGTTDVVGVLGVGMRYGLSRVTQLRFDLRDYISSFAPTRRAETFDAKLQNDIMATVGLEFVLTPGR